MLRWCIGLDLQEHPFLSVDQPAFTVGLLFVSCVIRLLLPHQSSLARLAIGLRATPLERSNQGIKKERDPAFGGVFFCLLIKKERFLTPPPMPSVPV